MKRKIKEIIKEIIKNNSVSNQHEISNILKEKYNIDITQSNISRILKEINVFKIVDDNKNMIYHIYDKLENTSSWIKNLIKKVDDNGYVISIISYPGSGQIVGQLIDEKNIDNNIMATISGDNTTIIIPKDIKKIKELRIKIEKILL